MAKGKKKMAKKGTSSLNKARKMSSAQMLLFAVLFALVGGAITYAALAAPRGGGGTKASVSGPVMVQDQNSNTLANFGDTITFNVSAPGVDQPYVELRCYQSGQYVYGAYAGYFPGAWFGRDFQLKSDLWTSGGADCTAKLFYYKKSGGQSVLTSMNFAVAP